MNFIEALKLMKEGAKVKLPSWGGYWCWDPEKQTIIMHTKDGEELDIRETQRVEYTTLNILSEEWQIADSGNCPQLGGEATFSFSDAIHYLKRGLKVARKGWNGKEMYLRYVEPYLDKNYKVIEYKPDGTLLPYIAIKTPENGFVPWVASQTDMLTNDWVFAE